MREASRITSGAHTELMRKMGKGEAKDEAEAESIFVAYCRKEGAKYQAYTPIVAAGAHAGTLHYVANDGPFPTTAPGSLLLVDAGGEFKNYAGDVTRCIPVRPSSTLAAYLHTHVPKNRSATAVDSPKSARTSTLSSSKCKRYAPSPSIPPTFS